MARKALIKILCNRDDCNEDEADRRIDHVLKRMEEVNFDPDECEEIMAEELGLEPDYIIDLLY